MSRKKNKTLSLKAFDEKGRQEWQEWQEKRKTKWVYVKFYVWVFIFLIFNYFSCACSFEIGPFKFNGFKDWGGSIALVVPELIFLFIFGARSKINHLEAILDKIASRR